MVVHRICTPVLIYVYVYVSIGNTQSSLLTRSSLLFNWLILVWWGWLITLPFQAGPVHCISLNSFYSSFKAGSKLVAWVEADLASVNKAATPWIVVR